MTLAVIDELNLDSLKALAERSIDVIHIKEYFEPELCKEIAGRVLESNQAKFYNKKYVKDVARIHTPYADAHGDKEAEAVYHKEAVASIRSTRDLFNPYLSPMDKLRLELAEYWPGSCTLQKLAGNKCFGGILRIFPPGQARFLAHYDKLDEETTAPEVTGLQNQFGVNIYLQVPDSGGELQLWLRYPSEAERENVRKFEGVPTERIENPKVSIKPGSGDLIMMSTWCLHGVEASEKAARISIGSFIGCYGLDRPLTIWS